MKDAATTPYGVWANATLRSGRLVSGELLAIDQQTAFLGLSTGLHVLPIPCISNLRLAVYEGDFVAPATLGFVGLLSTLSHGYILVFTAPVWGLTTGLTTHSASARGHETIQAAASDQVERARRFARFPTGLPPGYRERATVQEALDERCAKP
jgi:hypothetical protein